MISYQQLPGRLNQQALNGISDWFGMPAWVRDYWNVVKHNIQQIRDTGPKITAYWSRISNAQQALVARGDTAHAAQLDDELKKIADDMQKWSTTNQYITDYMPQWMGLDNPQEVVTSPSSAVSGLGFVPLILGAAAIAALAYVVNTGMALVQDYAFKSQLTQAVIEQKITSGQAKDILSVPSQEGVIAKAVEQMSAGIGFGIPTALLVAGGAYLVYQTGLLNIVLNMFKGEASSSPASGG